MTLPNDDLSVFKTANSGYAGVLTKKTEGYSIHLWECKKTLMLMNCCQNIFPTYLYVQVNLCQKLFYLKIMGRTFCVQKLFWMSETISVHTFSIQVWAWNFHVLNLKFNGQSVVILWVSWCKNKSFWRRFTCARNSLK